MEASSEVAGQPRLVWNRRAVTETFYTVTQLADELGMTPRAVRFYESKGLISPKRAGSTRIYTERERTRLVLVQRGKRLGFSLQDIKDYLELYEADQSDQEQLTTLLDGVRSRISQLEEQSAALALTMTELREIEVQASEALAKLKRCKVG
ncbi:MerR family transcriptional regulator [Acuticoccus sediminis]|uniref:MerR family transcriptional regulator n=1 Tax=Acuticoccus sediminis TaxID=2184697 RepID=A0A8B2P063_9HYPH|nr:MerR family DNA-binding transcriptional regulator [Acuticoccus sediminis]RAI04461.1 MerR family transcriptional regulator [Acuticoccus sediminis]